MSFLLEALRKSENQKKLGHAPSIHSTADLEIRRPSRLTPGVALLVLLPVVIVLAWFGWQYYKDRDEPELEKGPVQSELAAADSGSETSHRPKLLPEIPRGPGSKEAENSDRTPVESFAGPVRNSTTGSGSDNPVGEAQITEQTAPATTVESGLNTEAMSVPGSTNQAGELSGQAGSSPGHQARADDYQSPKMSVISYWRLPESIRDQMLVPKISVLVYSNRSEDRFILMNGSRLIEGDEHQPGLVLEEIRRDGAVFSFRHYQFLVTR